VSSDVTDVWQCDSDITLTLTLDLNKEYNKKRKKKRKRELNKETSIQALYVWHWVAKAKHKLQQSLTRSLYFLEWSESDRLLLCDKICVSYVMATTRHKVQ